MKVMLIVKKNYSNFISSWMDFKDHENQRPILKLTDRDILWQEDPQPYSSVLHVTDGKKTEDQLDRMHGTNST
jgi:hypothetical protein